MDQLMGHVNVAIAGFVALITDPIFGKFFIASNVISLICWLATIATDNYSHVDRLWSILPPLYAWGFLYMSSSTSISNLLFATNNTATYRHLIMVILPTLWGLRLSYNFWRKGGYNLSEEDYRWVHVRKMFNYPKKKLVWHLFNFAFTAFFQNYILLALVVPLWYSISSTKPLNALDVAVSALFLALFAFEIVADQQQWHFQTSKYKWLGSKKGDVGFDKKQVEEFKRGFLIKGLWKYSRHPNFFGEISLWWAYYLFSISSQFGSFNELLSTFTFSALVNYSMFGVFVLTLLFHKSTDLTEKITREKYPEYAKYQQHVSRIIPGFTTYQPKQK